MKTRSKDKEQHAPTFSTTFKKLKDKFPKPPTFGTLSTFARNRIAKPNPKAKGPSGTLLKNALHNFAASNARAQSTAVPEWQDPGPIEGLKDLRLSDFEIGRGLGTGQFGRVYLARHKATSFVCALKMLSKQTLKRTGDEKLVRREIEIHRNLTHPSVLRFHGWFHDQTTIYLILEYAFGGELYRRLKTQPDYRFTEGVAARYIAQMAQALLYLHKKKVMHRDIKPENILLGLQDEIKLADFGYSVRSSSNLRSTLCGTLDYLPPEIVKQMLKPPKHAKSYTNAVDLWSMGVLAYELVVGKAPFEEPDRAATQKRIVKGKFKFPVHVSKEARGFILALLTLDAEMRMSLEEVLAHPWIQRHIQADIE